MPRWTHGVLTLVMGLSEVASKEEYAVPLGPHHHNFPINVQSSDFTPMVTEVNLGQPGQPLLMALSFMSSRTVVYSGSQCPPNVVCFAPSRSAYYGKPEFLPDVHICGIRGSATLVENLLDIGNTVHLLHIYMMSRVELPSSLMFRDVAGVVGLGPTSPIVANSPILVQVRNRIVRVGQRAVPQWTVLFDAQTVRANDMIHIRARLVTEASKWTVFGTVGSSEGQVMDGTSITVAPNEPDIVAPLAHSNRFVRDMLQRGTLYYLDDSSRLFLPCAENGAHAAMNVMHPLIIRFEWGLKRYIRINPKHMVYSGVDNANSIIWYRKVYMCPTRLVFRESTIKWTFGLPLFASVESAIFSVSKQHITFQVPRTEAGRRSASLIPQLAVPLPPVTTPMYYSPEIVSGADGVSVVFRLLAEHGRNPEDFALVPISYGSEYLPSGDARFVFLKTRAGLRNLAYGTDQDIHRELDGCFHSPSQISGEEDGSILIELETATEKNRHAYSVSLEENYFTFIVYLRVVEAEYDIADLHLPEATRGAEDTVCVVCQDEFGDATAEVDPELGHEQSLPCKHWFHWNCIAPWLKQHADCPACRAGVRDEHDRPPKRVPKQ